MSEHNNAPAVPQGYEIHEIPADYSGLVWLEGQVRAVARRAQAATGPQGWTDADSDAARLALELECLLMDTKDLSVVSKWWGSANDALELHRQRLAATPAPTPAAGILDRARRGEQVVNIMRLAEAAGKAVASVTVPAPETGSESKIVIDVGPGGSGGGPAEAVPPATEQTAPAPAQESAITGEADVWHEGSKSFYRATLLHKLTPEEVFSEPPELDAYTQPAQEVGLTDGEPAHGAGLLEQRRELDAIEFFESTNRDFYEFKKSVRGIYANPAVARDWKWFQLGMKHATEDES